MNTKGAILGQILSFLKNPVYQEDKQSDFNDKYRVFIQLLFYALILSYGLGLLNQSLETFLNLDIGKHASEDFIKDAPWLLFLMAVVLAPLLEELFFRGPLFFFKDSPLFPYIFYLLTLIFGFYHILNFEFTSTTLWLSPLLVAPQLSVGVFLGFIRVRFGLPWSIALHAAYNLILIGPFILLQIFDLPVE
ncbi:CPBP family intramembrane glutamic endopeptidase [Pseudozobellia thermophila]|uniref:CAAX prenyl protease 2/Lysostaphin resistance protein A-like domain-containing protein n=1 Tax=Pseudozobellia thermophila TaxID=192903 RepID=A0A1M6F0E0_9FLAO|nr:CPBP family intramembrane glutamic endopeptidase [Pseudozobellia thermophila]SHI91153.1 hypothetical protein SAMN04488513_102249 [Pseudozobellia thermophila]